MEQASPSVLPTYCQSASEHIAGALGADMSNEMQSAGPDLVHLKQTPPTHKHTLFDRGMIQVSWQESSMIIAFLFTFPLPAVFTINGNSET